MTTTGQRCKSVPCAQDCCKSCVTGSKPLAVQLKTTAENQVLCAGSALTIIVTICNRSDELLENVTFTHFFGPQLKVSCLPKNVRHIYKSLGPPPPRCETGCGQGGLSACEAQLYRDNCDGTFTPRVAQIDGVEGVLRRLAPCQSKRVQYNLVVTDAFDFPSMTTSVTVCSFERQGEQKRVKLQSNKALLGATPITCKPFTISQPVPCKVLGCCAPPIPIPRF